jgi:hypothetical protein
LPIRWKWQQDVREQALRKVPEMANLDCRWDICVNGDVAATEDLQSIFVELDDALTCFPERLQRRIEGNSVLLAVAVELHLGEADVRHPGAASLENIFVAVGFQITADLACLSTSRSCEAFCFLLAYRILVVCVHVLDYALPSGILLGFGCCHIGRVARLWSSVDVARSSQMVSSRSKNGAEKPPPCANAPT